MSLSLTMSVVYQPEHCVFRDQFVIGETFKSARSSCLILDLVQFRGIISFRLSHLCGAEPGDQVLC